jgi:hypothetical protein
MVGVALVLAELTITRSVFPLQLLTLTFALSAGDAFESPAHEVSTHKERNRMTYYPISD